MFLPGIYTFQSIASQEQFFQRFGKRVCSLRKKHGFSQEDMLSFGFSTRFWQQVEAGRPITVTRGTECQCLQPDLSWMPCSPRRITV
jgi:hypothetical protein